MLQDERRNPYRPLGSKWSREAIPADFGYPTRAEMWEEMARDAELVAQLRAAEQAEREMGVGHE
jgi:hypothetical protein